MCIVYVNGRALNKKSKKEDLTEVEETITNDDIEKIVMEACS